MITKILKWGMYGYLVYNFSWIIKLGFFTTKLIMYVVPSVIYYVGPALLTIALL